MHEEDVNRYNVCTILMKMDVFIDRKRYDHMRDTCTQSVYESLNETYC